MRLPTKIASLFDSAVNCMAFLVGCVLIFVMLSVCFQVVMRYFFAKPILGQAEIAEKALVFITFLGAAWVLRTEGHVKMDLVLNRLKPGAQSLINVITSVIGAIVCLAFVWYGVKTTWTVYQTGWYTIILEIPLAYIMVFIPIGLFLFSIQFMKRTNGYLRLWRASRGQGQRSQIEPQA